MKFQFNIDLTDKDYVDFNVFWQTRSRCGRKMLIIFRIILLKLILIKTILIKMLWILRLKTRGKINVYR